MLLLVLGMLNNSFSEELIISEEPSATMIVESSSDIEVYVRSIKIENYSKNVKVGVADNSALIYTSQHWRGAKLKNDKGIYESITLTSDIKVYSEDTIRFAWDNCNYESKPRECTNSNDHLLLETTVLINDYQILVNMILYNSDMTILGSAVNSSKSKRYWIRQQNISTNQQNGLLQNSTTTNLPKEELPLEWVIPQNVMDEHIRECSARLWTGLRIN